MRFFSTTLKFIISLVLVSVCFLAEAQKKLPKSLLKELSKRIFILKKGDQNFNTDILSVFTNKGASPEEAELELKKMTKNLEYQRMLFKYWYDENYNALFFNDEVRGTYVSLLRYFRTSLLFNDEKASQLARYTSDLEFLTPSEKQKIRDSEKIAGAHKTREMRLLDSLFSLKKLDNNQYEEYKKLVISEMFNTFFEKDEEKFRSTKAIHVKEEQFNIDMVTSLTFKREFVLPSSFKVQEWEGHPAAVYIKTLQGAQYPDLVFLIPRDKYPITKWQNIYVKTMAAYENIPIKVSRGNCTAELSKDNIVYKEFEPKATLAKTKIAEKLKGSKPGIYAIKYYLGNVGDYTIDEIVVAGK